MPDPGPGLVWPKVSAQAEKASFSYHCRFVNTTQGPSESETGYIQNRLEEIYETAKWKNPANWRSLERIVYLIEENLNLKGSPGYPYCLTWATNADLLDTAKRGLSVQSLAQMVHERIEAILAWDETEDPGTLMRVSDPTRVFIKREFHKIEKAKLQRWRLIWSISVVDQLVDTVLWQNSLEAEVKNFETIPAKVGMGMVGGAWNRLYNDLQLLGKERYSISDYSGFDWTVANWCYEMDTESRLRLCVEGLDDEFRELARRRDKLMQKGLVIFSDGTLLQPLTGGIQKSGSKRTISMNSKINTFIKCLAAYRIRGYVDWNLDKIAAAGDDKLDRFHLDEDKYREVVESLGFIIKYLQVSDKIEDLSFCSFGFKRNEVGEFVPVPENWLKHQYNLRMKEKLNDEIQSQSLTSLLYLYSFVDDKFNILSALLSSINPAILKSQKYYKTLVAGWESAQVVSEWDRPLVDLNV